MNKENKVRIELNSKANASPPIKIAKAKNGRPDRSHFKFAPRGFGHLDQYVKEVRWNSVGKLFNLIISETAKFEVAKWLNYLDDQYHQYQKSPFVDVDNNTVVLDFLDESDRKVSTIRFKNLRVEAHECSLSRNNLIDFLEHVVTISYQHAEMVVHSDREYENDSGIFDGKKQNEAEDKEWQTVETPA